MGVVDSFSVALSRRRACGPGNVAVA